MANDRNSARLMPDGPGRAESLRLSTDFATCGITAATKTQVGGAGFEPAKAEPTDLQSVPFDRFGNPPKPS